MYDYLERLLGNRKEELMPYFTKIFENMAKISDLTIEEYLVKTIFDNKINNIEELIQTAKNFEQGSRMLSGFMKARRMFEEEDEYERPRGFILKSNSNS